ncbi:MAG TPA: adenylate/guanylate cyclase domain-containing protein [Bryobacteraceae bacterium]|jgi:class 3 adenylate cyclase|nr:adenylate/guanylate cyclase domain-containing protein [Bryobacteraceae bacterium]
MTIRRRINLSFLVIIFFFVANLVIYFWNSHRQSISADSLKRATSRQLLFSDVQQELTSSQKQIALLSQAMSGATGGGASPSDVSQFKAQLAKIADQIRQLEQLADTDMRPRISALRVLFDQLNSSWLIFYQNFGVNMSTAIKELALHGDPLSQQVIQQILPSLEADDRARAESVARRFFNEAEMSQRTNLGIFAISTIIAMLVGWLVLRYLVNGLNKLKTGAEQVGRVNLDFRIDIPARDELGELAGAFNDMAAKLSVASGQLKQRQAEVEKEKQHAETLLLNILPARAAKELREKGTVDPRYFEDVTIMFTDFVGFTLSTEKMAAEDLVRMLHDYFTAFDHISRRYGLEKLKTIGDSYMCITGLPVRNPAHPVDMVMAAFEMIHAVEERSASSGNQNWGIRVGIHTGPVVAGVVGIDKFAFDIWGDSVNFSSRMESSGARNRVNLSERTYSRVKDFFECEHRGKILTKDKREVDMYFANGILTGLIDPSCVSPPPSFVRRYKTYFEKEPPAFPDFLIAAGPVEKAAERAV